MSPESGSFPNRTIKPREANCGSDKGPSSEDRGQLTFAI